MSQATVLKVSMSCQGCAGAVKRVLEKMEGVESFNIDLEEQKVTVIGSVQPDVVLQTVSKSGKKASFWQEEAAARTEAMAPTETVAAAAAPAPTPAPAEGCTLLQTVSKSGKKTSFWQEETAAGTDAVAPTETDVAAAPASAPAPSPAPSRQNSFE